MKITRDLFIECVLYFWVQDTKQWKKAAQEYCACAVMQLGKSLLKHEKQMVQQTAPQKTA